MKTKYLFGALLLSAIFIISSCKKYEEGPAFSLRTKKARLCGDWKIESITYDGVDNTSNYSNYEWNIEKDESYVSRITSSGISIEVKGKWKFGEDKDDVYFTPDGGSEVSYRITKLKNTELWMKNTASNGKVTYIKLKQ